MPGVGGAEGDSETIGLGEAEGFGVGVAETSVAVGDAVEQDTSSERSTTTKTHALPFAVNRSITANLPPATGIHRSIAHGVFAASEVTARGSGREGKERYSTRSLDGQSLVPPAEKQDTREMGQETLNIGATGASISL